MANSNSNSISSSSSSNPIPKSKTTINDLPQHILIHILTFLYIQDAIQISLVSRSFRNLWHFLPSLHFDIEEFYSRSTSPARCDHTRQLFVDFVSQTLMFRQLNPLTKLHLTFEYTNDVHRYHVKSWVRYAINLSVSELVIDFRDENKFYEWDEWDDPDEDADEANHRLREFDFHILEIGNSRIKVLELYKCDFLINLANPIKFVFLKSLRLEATARPLWRDDVCYLLAQCVNLEILKFVKLEFNSKEGIVFHSSSLKELYLNLCSNDNELPLDLEICCPSLGKISLVSSELGKVINKDTSNLVEACIDFKPRVLKEEYNKSWEKMLSFFTNITSINMWDELLESNEVPAGCERFASNVKHLELYCHYSELDLVGVAALLKLLPKLEILGLDNKGWTEVNLHPDYRKDSTVFTMPCLKKVIMRKYNNTERERHFIMLFKTNGIVSDKIKLLRPSNQSEYSIN